jgi:hypothetical protein
MLTLSPNFISQGITFLPQFSLMQDLVVTIDYSIITSYTPYNSYYEASYEGGFLVGLYDNSTSHPLISSIYLTTESDEILTTENGLRLVINTSSNSNFVYTPFGYSAGPGLGYSNVDNLLGYDSNGAIHQLSATGIINGILGVGFDFNGLYATSFTGTSGIPTGLIDGYNTYEMPVTADGFATTSSLYIYIPNLTAGEVLIPSYRPVNAQFLYTQNAITLRGPALSGYPLLTTTGNLSGFNVPYSLYGQNTGDRNRIRIRLTDFGNTVIVDMYNFNTNSFTNYLNYTWQCPVTAGGIYFAYYTQLSGQQLKVYNINLNGFFTNNYIASSTHIPT